MSIVMNKKKKILLVFLATLFFYSQFLYSVDAQSEATIDNFNVVQRTVPSTASPIDFVLKVDQQDPDLDCSSVPGYLGNLGWVIWYETGSGDINLVRRGDTSLPISPDPITININIPDFTPSPKAISSGVMFFRAALGKYIPLTGCMAEYVSMVGNVAVSASVCVIVGSNGNCSLTPVTPGQPVAFNWEIINPLYRDPVYGQPQDIFDVIFLIANWLLNIAGALIVILIIYSGLRFMISRGNPGEIGRAKNILLWAIVGFAAVLIGKGFVTLIESFLRGSGFPSF